jgi:hypothetical protein
MNLFFPEFAALIEDYLSEAGIPAHVYDLYDLSDEGELNFGVAFPMGREFDLQMNLRQAQQDLSPLVGVVRFVPRTVLAYFAYDLFGNVPKPEGVGLSTNVVNLRDPDETSVDVDIRRVIGGRPVPNGSRRNAVALSYHIDAILISHTEDMTSGVPEALMDAAVASNRNSRYLRIGRLRWAWTRSRLVQAKPSLDFHELAV